MRKVTVAVPPEGTLASWESPGVVTYPSPEASIWVTVVVPPAGRPSISTHPPAGTRSVARPFTNSTVAGSPETLHV